MTHRAGGEWGLHGIIFLALIVIPLLRGAVWLGPQVVFLLFFNGVGYAVPGLAAAGTGAAVLINTIMVEVREQRHGVELVAVDRTRLWSRPRALDAR